MSDAAETEQRLALSREIQAQNPIVDGEEGAPAAAVLIGWTLVAEWMGADDERWLSLNASDASRRRPPVWVSNGHLHEALYGVWPNAEEPS